MAYLSYTLRNAVLRLADARQRPLFRSNSQGRSSSPAPRGSSPPPAHVTSRLESVFEALSELPFQPHVPAAFELACDALQDELPIHAMAAALYDIDADEMRFVSARGDEGDLLRGTSMPRAHCMGTEDEIQIARGQSAEAAWLGRGAPDSTVLLCPVVDDMSLLGLLALADPKDAAHFGPHDVELVRYVADQLAVFIRDHRRRVVTSAPA